jgi:hypothetical protein
MGTELASRRKRKQHRPEYRFPGVPGRLADFAAVNSLARLAVDDEHGNHRAMDEIEQRAAAFAGPSPSPLLESIGLTVALCEHDVRVRQCLAGPLADGERRLRNLDRSMRRYLAAVKALVVVQRSGLPPIQVNIAEQQIVATR